TSDGETVQPSPTDPSACCPSDDGLGIEAVVELREAEPRIGRPESGMAASDEGDAGAEHASIDLRDPEDTRSEEELGKLHRRVESTAELAEIGSCAEHRACTAEDRDRYALRFQGADVPGSLVVH